MVATGDLAAATLVVGMSIAGAYDLTTREVPDNLWRVMGLVGTAIVALTLSSNGSLLPVILWLVVAAYGLQFFFPWTDRLGERFRPLERTIDLALTALCVVIVAASAIAFGVGSVGVPYAVPAALAGIIVARALFESGLLAGGADAKAIIAIALVVPVFSPSWLSLGSASNSFLSVVPLGLNALVNGAIVALAIPLGIAVLNVTRREFRWPGGFTNYSVPVDELPRRFVWVDDPAHSELDEAREDVTAAEDGARRRAQMEKLRAEGVGRVRVSPQVPFVLFLAIGAVVALVAGNLLWDLAIAL